MMYRFIFWIVYMAMVVVHCQEWKYPLDDDDFSPRPPQQGSGFLWKCPNGNCTESETVPRCCKLSNIIFSNDSTVNSNNIAMERHNYNNYYPAPPPISLGKLIIENCAMQKIPKNLFTTLSPIILHIIQSDLKILKINDFSGAMQLVQLNITHNKIDNLEPNVFIYAPNIEVVDLSNNLISEVSEYAFDNVPKLKILILSNNLIKTFDLKSNLINLEIFMINNNSLTYLNENLLEKSGGLTELCLNNNKLNISKFNVKNIVEVFDMSNNPKSIYLPSKIFKIRNSNASALTVNRMVTIIDASENQINSVIVDSQNCLLELNLSKNNYTLMHNLTALKSIQKLDLSFNQIQDFSITSFSNMPDLVNLNLENSGLKTIDFGVFSQQSKLTLLDVSYNNLQKINLNMLATSLSKLYIEGNGLTNIELNDVHVVLPNLSTLGLANNKFSCEKLVEIRKVLTMSHIEMHVDETTIIKFSRNINGIGCLSENSSQTLEFRSNNLAPIHMGLGTSNHNSAMEAIEFKIKEIENNILQHNLSIAKDSVNLGDEILSLRQDIMSIQNDFDLKLINAKADILFSVSNLFNISKNVSVVSFDLKSTIDEVNKISLERFQLLSSQLKTVSDKLQNFVQSEAALKSDEHLNEENMLQLKNNDFVTDNDNQVNLNTKNEGIELSSMKSMMIFMIVTLLFLIFGFIFIVLYKRLFSVRRRYPSTNTINTNIEQSLV